MNLKNFVLSIMAPSLFLQIALGSCSFTGKKTPSEEPENHTHDYEIIGKEVGHFEKYGVGVNVQLKCKICGETKYEYAPLSEHTNLIQYEKSPVEDNAYRIVEVYNWVDPVLVIPETYKGLPVTEFSTMGMGENNFCSIVISKNLSYFYLHEIRHVAEIVDNYDVISETIYHDVEFYNIDLHKGEPKIDIQNGFVFYNKNGVIQCCGYETFPSSNLVFPDYYQENKEYEIRYGAFGLYRNLEGAHIGEGVYKIEEFNFQNIKPDQFELPDRYIEIEEDFSYNYNVQEEVNKGNDVYVGTTCLAACPKTNLTFKEGTKNIATGAFKSNRTTYNSIVFPDSLLYLGGNQLDHCSVTEMIFNSNLKKIGKDLFVASSIDFSSVTRAYFFGPTDINGNVFNFHTYNDTSILYLAKGANNLGTEKTTPEITIFEGDLNEYLNLDLNGPIVGSNLYLEVELTEYNYGKFNTKNYKDYCFSDEVKDSVLVLPKEVTTIKNYSFANWYFLTRIRGSGVTTIGDFAFSESKLEEATFENISKIGQNAFLNTYITQFNDLGNMNHIYIYTDIELAPFAFSYCGGTSYIFTKRDKETEQVEYGIPEGCFYGSHAEQIRFNYEPSFVDKLAFSRCDLKQFFVSNEIKYIGDSAFYSCFYLKLLMDENVDISNFNENWNLQYIYYDGTGRINYFQPYNYSETYSPHCWHYQNPNNKTGEKLLWDPEPAED